MKKEMILYYLGAAGLVLSAGVFLEDPLHGQWSGNPEALNNLLILYGFPLFFGLLSRASSLTKSAQPLTRRRKTILIRSRRASAERVLCLRVWPWLR